MKKLFPIVLMCLGASGAFAQSNKEGVTVSNDPAKAAAVEQHAQELKARAAQQAQTAPKAKTTSTASKAKSKAKKKVAHRTPTAKQ